MRILLALLVLGIGSVIWFFLAILGPHAFDPPAVYNIAADIELVVDDRSYVAHTEFGCRVQDQRQSIAMGDFHVDLKGDNPYVHLSGSSVAIVRGLGPCRWVKTAPAVGTKVKLVPRKDFSRIDSLRGTVWVIDDARSPTTGAVMSLTRLAGASGRWRLKSATLTSVPVVELASGDLPAVLPFLQAPSGMANSDLMIVQRMYTIEAVVRHAYCERNPTPPMSGWAPLADGCTVGNSFSNLHMAGARVDQAFARIDLDPEQSAPLVDSVVLFGPALLTRRGRLPGEEVGKGSFTWTPQVCVSGQCWAIEMGRELELMDPSRSLGLVVTTRVAEGRELLRNW